MPLDIYISSIGFSNIDNVDKLIEKAKKHNFAIEFSSGMPFDNLMIEKYINCTIKRMPHNYFPAPEQPFVLNLASSNDEIRNTSIRHCINGLRLAKTSLSPFFSAHIGFCIDPDPQELGEKMKNKNVKNRELHIEIFINSVNLILKEAEKLNIDFLIENNVITKFNMMNGVNPLLGCNSEEIITIFNQINSPHIGLLLDTAHLKVSCNTLELALESEVINLKKYIKCIHHSDNNGLIDNNLKLEKSYWFLPLMKNFNKIPHVIEVKNLTTKEIEVQILIIENHETRRNTN